MFKALRRLARDGVLSPTLLQFLSISDVKISYKRNNIHLMMIFLLEN